MFTLCQNGPSAIAMWGPGVIGHFLLPQCVYDLYRSLFLPFNMQQYSTKIPFCSTLHYQSLVHSATRQQVIQRRLFYFIFFLLQNRITDMPCSKSKISSLCRDLTRTRLNNHPRANHAFVTFLLSYQLLWHAYCPL